MSKIVEYCDIILPTKDGTVIRGIALEFAYTPELKDFLKKRLKAYRLQAHNMEPPLEKYNVGNWDVDLKVWWCHERIWTSLKNDLKQWLEDNLPGWKIEDGVCTSGKLDDAYFQVYGMAADEAAQLYKETCGDEIQLKELHKRLTSYSADTKVDTTVLSREEVHALSYLDLELPTSLAAINKAYEEASNALDNAHGVCLNLLKRRESKDAVTNTEL